MQYLYMQFRLSSPLRTVQIAGRLQAALLPRCPKGGISNPSPLCCVCNGALNAAQQALLSLELALLSHH